MHPAEAHRARSRTISAKRQRALRPGRDCRDWWASARPPGPEFARLSILVTSADRPMAITDTPTTAHRMNRRGTFRAARNAGLQNGGVRGLKPVG